MDSSVSAAIRRVPHFCESGYRDLDVAGTLEYFRDRFVRPLTAQVALDASHTILDVGAGYGWLAIALAQETDCAIIAIDADEARIEAARRIAEILGIGDRIEFLGASLGQLPLKDQAVDVTLCVEVLEHLNCDSRAPLDLARVTRDHLLVTTPNRWFPVIAHDTRLPICHWLPLPMRRVYAQLMNRADGEMDNLFWSAPQLERYLPGFRRSSRWMHYRSISDFFETYPHYQPYGGGVQIRNVPALRKAYYNMVAPLGRASRYVLPTLAGLYSRQDGGHAA